MAAARQKQMRQRDVVEEQWQEGLGLPINPI